MGSSISILMANITSVPVEAAIQALNQALDMPDDFLVIIGQSGEALPWQIGEKHQISVVSVRDLLTTEVKKEGSVHIGKKVLLLACNVSEGGTVLPYSVILPLAALRAVGKNFVINVEVTPNKNKDGGKIVSPISVKSGNTTVTWEQFSAKDKIESLLGRKLPESKAGLESIFAQLEAEPATAGVGADDDDL